MSDECADDERDPFVELPEPLMCPDCGADVPWPTESEREALRMVLDAAPNTRGTDVPSAMWGAAKVLNAIHQIGVSS